MISAFRHPDRVNMTALMERSSGRGMEKRGAGEPGETESCHHSRVCHSRHQSAPPDPLLPPALGTATCESTQVSLTSSWGRGPRSPSTPGSSACSRLRTLGTCYRPPDPAWRDPRLGHCGGAEDLLGSPGEGRCSHGWTRPVTGFAVCVGGLRGCRVEQASQLASLLSQVYREGRAGGVRRASPQSVPAERSSLVGLSAAAEAGVGRRADCGWWVVVTEVSLQTGTGRHRVMR